MTRQIFRFALIVPLVLGAVFVGGAASANAPCTSWPWCHAIAETHVATIDGVASQITPTCLTAALTGPGTATDEVWLADPSTPAWVEVGYIASYQTSPFADGLSAWWADERPQDAFPNNHVIVAHPADIERQAEIRISSTNTYLVAFAGFANHYSVDNAMSPYWGQIGSEIHNSGLAHSMAKFGAMVYHENGNWSTRLYNPTVGVDYPPMVQSWITMAVSQNAGEPC